jgi:hypothetical protein
MSCSLTVTSYLFVMRLVSGMVSASFLSSSVVLGISLFPSFFFGVVSSGDILSARDFAVMVDSANVRLVERDVYLWV